MKRTVSLLLAVMVLLTTMTGWVPAVGAQSGAQITDVVSLIEGAEAYYVLGTLYQDFPGAASAPKMGLTFAKESGAPFAEGAQVTCVTADGVTVVQDVALDANSYAEIEFVQGVTPGSGVLVTFTVTEEGTEYSTGELLLNSRRNQNFLYFAQMEYSEDEGRYVPVTDQQRTFMEIRGEMTVALYTPDTDGELVALTAEQLAKFNLVETSFVSKEVIDGEPAVLKLTAQNSGICEGYYINENSKFHSIWVSTHAQQVPSAGGSYTFTNGEEEIDRIEIQQSPYEEIAWYVKMLQKDGGFTQEEAEAVYAVMNYPSDPDYSGMRVECEPHHVTDKDWYDVQINIYFDEERFENDTYTCELAFYDGNGELMVTVPFKYLDKPTADQLFVRRVEITQDEETGENIYTEVGPYETMLYMAQGVEEPLVFYYHDGNDYVRIEGGLRSNVVVMDGFIVSESRYDNQDDGVIYIKLLGMVDNDPDDEEFPSQGFVYFDGADEVQYWIGAVIGGPPSTGTEGEYTFVDGEPIETMEIQQSPYHEVAWWSCVLQKEGGFTQEEAEQVWATMDNPSDPDYDGMYVECEAEEIKDQPGSYQVGVAVHFDEERFEDNNGEYTCDLNFYNGDGSWIAGIPFIYRDEVMDIQLYARRVDISYDEETGETTYNEVGDYESMIFMPWRGEAAYALYYYGGKDVYLPVIGDERFSLSFSGEGMRWWVDEDNERVVHFESDNQDGFNARHGVLKYRNGQNDNEYFMGAYQAPRSVFVISEASEFVVNRMYIDSDTGYVGYYYKPIDRFYSKFELRAVETTVEGSGFTVNVHPFEISEERDEYLLKLDVTIENYEEALGSVIRIQNPDGTICDSIQIYEAAPLLQRPYWDENCEAEDTLHLSTSSSDHRVFWYWNGDCYEAVAGDMRQNLYVENDLMRFELENGPEEDLIRVTVDGRYNGVGDDVIVYENENGRYEMPLEVTVGITAFTLLDGTYVGNDQLYVFDDEQETVEAYITAYHGLTKAEAGAMKLNVEDNDGRIALESTELVCMDEERDLYAVKMVIRLLSHPEEGEDSWYGCVNLEQNKEFRMDGARFDIFRTKPVQAQVLQNGQPVGEPVDSVTLTEPTYVDFVLVDENGDWHWRNGHISDVLDLSKPHGGQIGWVDNNEFEWLRFYAHEDVASGSSYVWLWEDNDLYVLPVHRVASPVQFWYGDEQTSRVDVAIKDGGNVPFIIRHEDGFTEEEAAALEFTFEEQGWASRYEYETEVIADEMHEGAYALQLTMHFSVMDDTNLVIRAHMPDGSAVGMCTVRSINEWETEPHMKQIEYNGKLYNLQIARNDGEDLENPWYNWCGDMQGVSVYEDRFFARFGLAAMDEWNNYQPEDQELMEQIENVDIYVEKADKLPVHYAENGYAFETDVLCDGYLYIGMNVEFKEESGLEDVYLYKTISIGRNHNVRFERPEDDTVEELNEFLASDELRQALEENDKLTDVRVELSPFAVYEGDIIIPDSLPWDNTLILSGNFIHNDIEIEQMTQVNGSVVVRGTDIRHIVGIHFVNPDDGREMAVALEDGAGVDSISMCVFEGYGFATKVDEDECLYGFDHNRVYGGAGLYINEYANSNTEIRENDFIGVDFAVYSENGDKVRYDLNYYGSSEHMPATPAVLVPGYEDEVIPFYAIPVAWMEPLGRNRDRVAILTEATMREDGTVILTVGHDWYYDNQWVAMRAELYSETNGIEVTLDGEPVGGAFYDRYKQVGYVPVVGPGTYEIRQGEEPKIKLLYPDGTPVESFVELEMDQNHLELVIHSDEGFTRQQADEMAVWVNEDEFSWNGTECAFDFPYYRWDTVEELYDVGFVLDLENLQKFLMGFYIDVNGMTSERFCVSYNPDDDNDNYFTRIEYDGEVYDLALTMNVGTLEEPDVMRGPFTEMRELMGMTIERQIVLGVFEEDGENLHPNADKLLEQIESVGFDKSMPQNARAEDLDYETDGFYGFNFASGEVGVLRTDAHVTFKAESGIEPVTLTTVQRIEFFDAWEVYREADDDVESLNAYLDSEEFRNILADLPEEAGVKVMLHPNAVYNGVIVVPGDLPKAISIIGQIEDNGREITAMTEVHGGMQVYSNMDKIGNIRFIYDENVDVVEGIVIDEDCTCSRVVLNEFYDYPGAALCIEQGGLEVFDHNILRNCGTGIVGKNVTCELGVYNNDFIALDQDIVFWNDMIYWGSNFFGDDDDHLHLPNVSIKGQDSDFYPIATEDMVIGHRFDRDQIRIPLIDDYYTEDGLVRVTICDDEAIHEKDDMILAFDSRGYDVKVTFEDEDVWDWSWANDEHTMISIPIASRGRGTYEIVLDNSALVMLTSRIQGIPGQTVAQLQGGGRYPFGETATLVAPAVEGYNFVGWFYADDRELGYGGDCVSEEKTFSFTVETDTGLVAVYEPAGALRLRVYGRDFLFNGEGPKKTTVKKNVTVGEEITLEYVGEDSFLYWKNGADKIVSTDPTYRFVMVTATDLTLEAVEMSDGASYALVEFVSDYDQVMYADTWYSTDSAEDYAVPAGPSKPGYVFRGWEYDVQTILSMIDGKNPVITVHPVYESEENRKIFTILNNVDDIVLNKTGLTGETLWIQAPARDGWKFSHMEDENGSVITYNATHAFWITGDYTVKLVYVMEDEVVEQKPTLVMTDSRVFVEEGKVKASFTVTRNVPEGYELLEHGVLVNRDGRVDEGNAELEMVLEGGSVIKVTSTDRTQMGTYVQNVTATTPGATIFCRGYLICRDTDGELITIYTDVAGVNP